MLRSVFVITLAALCLAQSPPEKGRRFALVIGNANYRPPLPHLTQPVHDAKLMADTLKAAGFSVTEKANLGSVSDFKNTINTFAGNLGPNDVVVVYFSGLAAHSERGNYLLPVNFDPKGGLGSNTYTMRRLIEDFSDFKGLAMFIVEAARAASEIKEADQPALVIDFETPRNRLFAFAASSAQPAPAGTSGSSAFTYALADSLKEPGRPLNEVFRAAKSKLAGDSGLPAFSENVVRPDFYFTYPALAVNPPSFTFTSSDEAAPAAQGMNVYAGGYQARIALAAPTDADWLKVSSKSGKTSKDFTPDAEVSVTPGKLKPGTYESEIVITAPNADLTGAPKAVPVKMVILPPKLPAAPSGPQTNAPRDNPKNKMQYLWIPSGSFTMGCSAGDKECKGDEKPAHPVQITKGFWMGRTEVTVSAYKRYVQENRLKMPPATPENRGWSNDQFPMVNVTWKNASDFCGWSGGRLPTEAEWEYAARAGKTTPYPWGTEINKNLARYEHNMGSREKWQNSWENFAPVAQFEANAWGLFDVVGNVWEWVSDWYQDSFEGASEKDPTGPASGTKKVLRGGSFHSGANDVRVSRRNALKPEDRFSQDGFRCLSEAQRE